MLCTFTCRPLSGWEFSTHWVNTKGASSWPVLQQKFSAGFPRGSTLDFPQWWGGVPVVPAPGQLVMASIWTSGSGGVATHYLKDAAAWWYAMIIIFCASHLYIFSAEVLTQILHSGFKWDGCFLTVELFTLPHAFNSLNFYNKCDGIMLIFYEVFA